MKKKKHCSKEISLEAEELEALLNITSEALKIIENKRAQKETEDNAH